MTGRSVVKSASNSASGSPCGCSLRLQPHQVDDVDDAHLQLGQVLAEQVDRGQRLERRDVAGAAPCTTSGSPPSSLLAQSQMPSPRVQCMIASSIDSQFERRLLAGDDHVDVVAAAQAVVGDREQRVRVRRQVDADDLRLLVHDVVDEARVLVEKPLWSWRQTCEVSR